jgi:lipopolysaccharide biosynthesis protein
MLYAHHSESGRLERHSQRVLAALRPLCARVRVLSTSLSPGDAAACVDDVSVFDNVGFDFGMWKRALADEALDDVDEVVFANSSVAGPFADVDSVFDRMSGAAAWGLTHSAFPVAHMQSFFFAVQAPVLRSAALRQFFDSVLLYDEKWAAISSYEIGLSCWLRQHGHAPRVAFPSEQLAGGLVAARLTRNDDPSIVRAADLADAGCPFVKLALLQGRAAPGASLLQRGRLSVHGARLRHHLERRGVDWRGSI